MSYCYVVKNKKNRNCVRPGILFGLLLVTDILMLWCYSESRAFLVHW